MLVKKIAVASHQIDCQTDESLLDALLRAGITIPYACKAGICQSCMIRSLNGPPPETAQLDLPAGLRHQDYFLACLCHPHEDMSIEIAPATLQFNTGTVVSKSWLNSEILLLELQLETPFDYYAGQFVNLRRSDGLTRSYSIANQRQAVLPLSFHIRRLPGGRFSEWAHRDLAIGEQLDVSAPQGQCYYLPDDPGQNLLLIGTGSGLAPLAGILAEALQHNHYGDIHLYHGSRDLDGLYWIEEMRQLARRYPNFHYTACLSGDATPSPGIARGRAHEIALAAFPQLKNWRIYLCGHPEMVKQSKRKAFLQGAGLQQIYSDAFHVSAAPDSP